MNKIKLTIGIGLLIMGVCLSFFDNTRMVSTFIVGFGAGLISVSFNRGGR